MFHTFYFVEKNYKCYDKFQQNRVSDNAMWLKLWDEILHKKSCIKFWDIALVYLCFSVAISHACTPYIQLIEKKMCYDKISTIYTQKGVYGCGMKN